MEGQSINQSINHPLICSNNNNMATPTPFETAPTPPLPPLLVLPLELKLQIISHLQETQDCSLRILRRVHSSFRHIINPHGPSTCPDSVRKAELQTAEDKHPYLFPPDHFPCYCCYDVFPGSSFNYYYLDCGHVCDWIYRRHGDWTEKDALRETRRCNGCQRW